MSTIIKTLSLNLEQKVYKYRSTNHFMPLLSFHSFSALSSVVEIPIMRPEVLVNLTLASFTYVTDQKNIKIQIGVFSQIIKESDICRASSQKTFFFFFYVAALYLDGTGRKGARRRRGISWLIHCLFPDNHDKVINE